MTNIELGYLILLFLLIMLFYCKTHNNYEYFGVDNKPFEPDNSMLNRNPYDDIDYIVPVFKIKF